MIMYRFEKINTVYMEYMLGTQESTASFPGLTSLNVARAPLRQRRSDTSPELKSSLGVSIQISET